MNRHLDTFELIGIANNKEQDLFDIEYATTHLKKCEVCSEKIKFLRNPFNTVVKNEFTYPEPPRLKTNGYIFNIQFDENIHGKVIWTHPVLIISDVYEDNITGISLVDILNMHDLQSFACTGDLFTCDNDPELYRGWVISLWSKRSIPFKFIDKSSFTGIISEETMNRINNPDKEKQHTKDEHYAYGRIIYHQEMRSRFRQDIGLHFNKLTDDLENRREFKLNLLNILAGRLIPRKEKPKHTVVGLDQLLYEYIDNYENEINHKTTEYYLKDKVFFESEVFKKLCEKYFENHLTEEVNAIIRMLYNGQQYVTTGNSNFKEKSETDLRFIKENDLKTSLLSTAIFLNTLINTINNSVSFKPISGDEPIQNKSKCVFTEISLEDFVKNSNSYIDKKNATTSFIIDCITYDDIEKNDTTEQMWVWSSTEHIDRIDSSFSVAVVHADSDSFIGWAKLIKGDKKYDIILKNIIWENLPEKKISEPKELYLIIGRI